ncbi:MAG: hypothetical protein E7675_04335, partial [Ruminococcaceae bacterium]|nr:hypothetical protein [Oscillospiraceae bacterium]
MKTFFKKSALIFTVCMLLTLQLIVIEVANNLNTYAETESNETTIYNFLKEEMGFNTAAACGVLANIQNESGFRNDVVEYGYTWDTGGGYGICQWTNSPRSSSTGRRTNLVNWCNDNGYDYTSLIGQLNFLKHELNTNYYYYWVTSELLKVDNSAQGAYDAGYIWCYYFEVPAGYDTGVSETRGNLAKNSYWTKYNNSEESFSSKIAYLQKKFPDGKYWNHSVGGQNNPDGYTSTPCTHHYGTVPCSHTDCQGEGGCCYYGQCGCNSYSKAVQCMGFALKLGYDIFGSDPRNWTSVKSLDNLKAGDIIMYNSHHIFVTSVNGNTITFADCNYNGNCQIRWNQTITKSNIKNLKYVLQSPATFEDTTPQDYLATKFSATVLDGIYLLKNTGGGLMANVYDGINEDETNVMLWEYDKTSDQWFYIKHVGNGKYLIYAVCSKKSDGSYERCLDIYTGSPSALPSAGDNVDIYTRSSSWDSCQLFYIVPMSDGTFVFESCAVPQLVIGASNVTQNYGNISMMAYSGSSAQKWKLCDEKGNDISNSSIYKTKVTFSYNSNSGQGTMSSSYAYQGDSITFTANTFTRDNYKFMGWKIQRDDGKWYIEEYGWYPEDIINERGYTVTVYPDRYTMVLDNDFVTQPDNFSCTLYAQWDLECSHNWVTDTVYSNATCTSSGSARHKCSVCGETKEVTLSALGHDKISHSGQAATCTSKGWNAYETCSRCSYSTYSEISALGHNKISHSGQAATCTSKGWNAYETCSRCSYSTYSEISALGHNKISHSGQAATCTSKGWNAYETCSRCSYSTYSEIPVSGHNIVLKGINQFGSDIQCKGIYG